MQIKRDDYKLPEKKCCIAMSDHLIEGDINFCSISGAFEISVDSGMDLRLYYCPCCGEKIELVN